MGEDEQNICAMIAKQNNATLDTNKEYERLGRFCDARDLSCTTMHVS